MLFLLIFALIEIVKETALHTDRVHLKTCEKYISMMRIVATANKTPVAPL